MKKRLKREVRRRNALWRAESKPKLLRPSGELPLVHPQTALEWRKKKHKHIWVGEALNEKCDLCWRPRSEVSVTEGGWAAR